MTPLPRYPTVLLRHDAPAGTHHDWLLHDPLAVNSPDAPLWAARVIQPSRDWPALHAWDLTPLPPHRRAYLTFEGPLTPDKNGTPRGSVTRIDEGDFAVLDWSDERFVIDLRFRGCAGVVEARRVTPTLWRAAWVKQT
ncbi:MAG: hypothetical protein K8S99_12850 [Planctomycetes bacterium]|nr:hypothetical protein [Planctomycetota bacterium]